MIAPTPHHPQGGSDKGKAKQDELTRMCVVNDQRMLLGHIIHQ